MACTIRNIIHCEGNRDDEGHRTYTLVYLVESAITDGPYAVMQTPGLPRIGSSFSYRSNVDPWAFCYPTMKVTPHGPDENKPEAVRYWRVQLTFGTKPVKKCQDVDVQDPLLEPQKVSGSFSRYSKEATKDKDGEPIRTPSYELIRGKNVEFDEHRAEVKIEQNVASLGLATFTSMINKVNDATLWGLSARCIKLGQVSWERKVRGICEYYYTRTLEFDIDFNTHDRDVMPEGTKCLKGAWDKSGTSATYGQWKVSADVDMENIKPSDFVRFTDWNGNPAKCILTNDGKPWDGDTTGDDVIGNVHIERYSEANFLLLGIPLVF